MERMQTTVSYSNHPEAMDLTGKDLMSVFGKSKDDLASATGLNFSGSSVDSISVPTEKVTSLAGEIADEIHEWPNARQGKSFTALSLHFRDGKLTALEWNFSLATFLPQKKAWYKRWL